MLPQRQYIGARYVPKFFTAPDGSNNWVPGIAYEPLTIVTYANNSFTSKTPVPASSVTPNLDTEHWINTGNFNTQLDEYKKQVTALSTKIDNYNTEFTTYKNNQRLVNVLDFGAKGDGITDDTNAIKNAATFAMNNKDPLYFPAGTYIFNGTITVDNNYLEAYGEINGIDSVSQIKSRTNAPIFNLKSSAYIHDLNIVGAVDTSFTSQVGIILNNHNSIYINRVHFLYLYTGIEIIDTVFYSNIYNCKFFGCYFASIYGHGTSKPGYALTISNCTCVEGGPNVPQNGFVFENIGSLIVSDCDIGHNVVSGVGLDLRSCAPSAGISLFVNVAVEQPHALQIGSIGEVRYMFFTSFYFGSDYEAINLVNARSCYFSNGYVTGASKVNATVNIQKISGDIKFDNVLAATTNYFLSATTGASSIDITLQNCTCHSSKYAYFMNIPSGIFKQPLQLLNITTNPNVPPVALNTYTPLIMHSNHSDRGLTLATAVYKGTAANVDNVDITVDIPFDNMLHMSAFMINPTTRMPEPITCKYTTTLNVNISNTLLANRKYQLVISYNPTNSYI